MEGHDWSWDEMLTDAPQLPRVARLLLQEDRTEQRLGQTLGQRNTGGGGEGGGGGRGTRPPQPPPPAPPPTPSGSKTTLKDDQEEIDLVSVHTTQNPTNYGEYGELRWPEVIRVPEATHELEVETRIYNYAHEDIRRIRTGKESEERKLSGAVEIRDKYPACRAVANNRGSETSPQGVTESRTSVIKKCRMEALRRREEDRRAELESSESLE
ncbi:hypothetical protein Q7C36_007442 [Tachysurus vachellii]|uniref:Uncharacterized protein n=1 Tax=Tachysurus vachellii TaxID=175792 RepID=A0AA88SZI4_TACVA|nr:hypothetical protein Q7C36_007442 [Tachysurus vachellii]